MAETAGLVLAVLPFLIEALSVYKRGLEKTGFVFGFKQKRYKVKVERPRLRLKGQSASLHLNLVKLVRRAILSLVWERRLNCMHIISCSQ